MWFRAQNEVVKAVSWSSFVDRSSSRCNLIAFSGRLGAIFIAHDSSRKWSPIQAFAESHGNEVTALEFNPTKPWLLASASTDFSIRVWDCLKMVCVCIIVQTLSPFGAVTSLSWAPPCEETADKLFCAYNTFEIREFVLD